MVKQSKSIEILDYLSVDNIFPFPIITVKNGNLYSIQVDKDGYIHRYVMFQKDVFKEIEGNDESVKIDAEKVRKFIGYGKADDIVLLQYPSPKSANKIMVHVGRFKTHFAVTKIDKGELKTGLPFKLNDGVPYLHKVETNLDTHITVSLKSFKDMVLRASGHGTEFYRFKIGKDRKLEVLVGDIHELEDFTSAELNSVVNTTNEELDVTYAVGIKELAKVMSKDVEIRTRSGMPAWISEMSHNHKFGMLIPPVRGE